MESNSTFVNSSASSNDYPAEQMIAEAAYYRAEKRGFTPENDLDDWLQAEADLAVLSRDGSAV